MLDNSGKNPGLYGDARSKSQGHGETVQDNHSYMEQLDATPGETVTRTANRHSGKTGRKSCRFDWRVIMKVGAYAIVTLIGFMLAYAAAEQP